VRKGKRKKWDRRTETKRVRKKLGERGRWRQGERERQTDRKYDSKRH